MNSENTNNFIKVNVQNQIIKINKNIFPKIQDTSLDALL